MRVLIFPPVSNLVTSTARCHPPTRRWRYSHTTYCTTDLDCYRILAKQDLPTQEGHPQDFVAGLRCMAPKELHTFNIPLRHLDALWTQSWPQHTQQLQHHITHKDIVRFTQLFPDAVFHNEDKRATSLRIYCPCLYFECLEATFADPKVFRCLEASPSHLIHTIMENLTKRFKRSYPWSLGRGRELPNAYVLPKRRNNFALATLS